MGEPEGSVARLYHYALDMCRVKPMLQRFRVLHKLQHSSLGGQRNDLVAPDPKFASHRLAVILQYHIDDGENLLHHGVLAEIVTAFALVLWQRLGK